MEGPKIDSDKQLSNNSREKTHKIDPTQLSQVPCILCGIKIYPNASMMCNQCVIKNVNQEELGQLITLDFCSYCKKYFGPPWIAADFESQELLTICLKKIRILEKVKLINASFIYTEPHSKRIKIKLTIQKAEMEGKITLESTFINEFIVHYTQCEDCKKSFTPHKWIARVQIRQKAEKKSTISYIEQLIIKNKEQQKAIKVKSRADGIDIYYKTKQDAQTLVNFVKGYAPIKEKKSKELVSADDHSNTHYFKFTFALEVAPVSRYDLVLFPKKLLLNLGAKSPLQLCLKVSSNMLFLDAITFHTYTIDPASYWNHDLVIIASKNKSKEFTVLPNKYEYEENEINQNGIYKIGKIELQEKDNNNKCETLYTKSHFANILKFGDIVLGYIVNELIIHNFDDIDKFKIPGIIVFKKKVIKMNPSLKKNKDFKKNNNNKNKNKKSLNEKSLDKKSLKEDNSSEENKTNERKEILDNNQSNEETNEVQNQIQIQITNPVNNEKKLEDANANENITNLSIKKEIKIQQNLEKNEKNEILKKTKKMKKNKQNKQKHIKNQNSNEKKLQKDSINKVQSLEVEGSQNLNEENHNGNSENEHSAQEQKNRFSDLDYDNE